MMFSRVPTRPQTPQRQHKVSGMKSSAGLSISGLDGAHPSTCIVHTNITHVCIAVLTGSGFISLSSVFISDGCTPLRLTPYATHRRPCTKNQTSQIHTQNGIHIDTCIHSSPLSVHISLHRNPVNRPLSLTIQV